MRNLRLDRPLAFFDLETTGTDPARDRIVEIAVVRVEPDGSRVSRTRRIDPERPIPAEATAIHGIRDEDVRGAPTFRQVARSLLELLHGSDLAGFNVLRFDIPLLEREFRDCGMDLGLADRHVLDVLTIYHRLHPRDLSAAAQHYLGRPHERAHCAEADTAVVVEILEAQLAQHGELPRDVAGLDRWLRPRSEAAIDRGGKLVRRNGEPAFAFGKHRGRTLREVERDDPGYLDWIAASDLPDDVKEIVRGARAASAEGQST